MPILLITGMPGSGKEEFLNAARDMGIPFLRMGDLVRERYASTGTSGQGISVGQFADLERKTFGKDIWAKRALEKIASDLFLIDGCRSMDEVLAYRELHENVIVIAIHSPPRMRYARLVNRNRDDAPRNTDDFDARDARELSWGLGDVMALSDIMVDNSSTLEDFHARAHEILKAIR
jgi:dephospho-CoA kinase